MAVIGNASTSVLALPRPPRRSSDHRRLHFGCRSRILSGNSKVLFKSSRSRIRTFQHDDEQSSNAAKSEAISDDPNVVSDIVTGLLDDKTDGSGNSFLSKLGILLGIAAVITLVLVGLKPPNLGTSTGIQIIQEGSSSTLVSTSAVFSFRAFGYKVVLPEYAPGWIYFWLLMAAGFGLFISEEALNVWVGVTLGRLLSLDGTRQSLVDSFSRNAPYILSTVLWVYWGVCISDMIPFYLGKLFRQSRASDDIRSKLGVGEEKAKAITGTVRRYGNLIGFGYITRVFLRRCLLWWTDNSSDAVGSWILAKRPSSVCACNCRHCSGNLDYVSICFGCSDSTVPLSAKALLELVMLIVVHMYKLWRRTGQHPTKFQSLVEFTSQKVNRFSSISLVGNIMISL